MSYHKSNLKFIKEETLEETADIVHIDSFTIDWMIKFQATLQ